MSHPFDKVDKAERELRQAIDDFAAALRLHNAEYQSLYNELGQRDEAREKRELRKALKAAAAIYNIKACGRDDCQCVGCRVAKALEVEDE